MGIFVCHRRSLLNLGSCRRTTVREGSAVSLWRWLKQSTANPAGGSRVGAGWVGVGTQIEAWGGLQLRVGNEEVGESGLDPCWRSWWGGKGEPGSLGSSRAFCPFLPCLYLVSFSPVLQHTICPCSFPAHCLSLFFPPQSISLSPSLSPISHGSFSVVRAHTVSSWLHSFLLFFLYPLLNYLQLEI